MELDQSIDLIDLSEFLDLSIDLSLIFFFHLMLSRKTLILEVEKGMKGSGTMRKKILPYPSIIQMRNSWKTITSNNTIIIHMNIW